MLFLTIFKEVKGRKCNPSGDPGLECGSHTRGSSPVHPAIIMSHSYAYFIRKSTSQYSLTFDKTLHTNTYIHRDGITTPTAVIKLIHFGFHKYNLWLLVVSRGGGARGVCGGGGQAAADTWNDWESAACSHYLVPCIVIITPALSAPLLPSLLAIVIVIDWCGGQNSAVWKGIRHTSHNRPAIWSSPPPPSHWLLLHLSIPLVFFFFFSFSGWREVAARR